MKRILFLLGWVLIICSRSVAQSNTGNPLLHPDELHSRPWFYNLDSAIANPDSVFKLSLNKMKLKNIPEDIFTFKNLQILNLSENRIKEIPVELMELKNLQFLSFFKNRLKFVPLELKKLNNLEVLFLGNNKLMDLPVWIGGIGKLRRVDISGNRFSPLEITRIKEMLSHVDLTW